MLLCWSPFLIKLKATIGVLRYLSASGRVYNSRPILISPTCKRENALSHAKLIGRVIQVCQAHAPSILWSVASDGESHRGAALAQLTLKCPLNPNSKIFPLLSPLHHLNLLVGDNDVTCDKDFKHLFKRLRTLLLQMGGFCILNMTITPSVLEQHLHEGGVSSVSLQTLLNPSDKQDVPKALELLKHVSDLSLAPDDHNPTWIAQRHAIYLMGHICYLLMQPFTDVTFCLQQQLEYLSAASHLLLVLF